MEHAIWYSLPRAIRQRWHLETQDGKLWPSAKLEQAIREAINDPLVEVVGLLRVAPKIEGMM